ncbi:hypothetical protein HDU91_002728 [Kappamyces sp. JEL0680]|nr:hypothetical protein HDU91_002728 [Kappamyces sp. JEL0680]
MGCALCLSFKGDLAGKAVVRHLRVFLEPIPSAIVSDRWQPSPLVLAPTKEAHPDNCYVCTACMSLNQMAAEKQRADSNAEIRHEIGVSATADCTSTATQTDSDPLSKKETTPAEAKAAATERNPSDGLSLQSVSAGGLTGALAQQEQVAAPGEVSNTDTKAREEDALKVPKRPYPKPMQPSLVVNEIRNSPVRPPLLKADLKSLKRPASPFLQRMVQTSVSESPANAKKIRSTMANEVLDSIFSECVPGSPKEYKRTHIPTSTLPRE